LYILHSGLIVALADGGVFRRLLMELETQKSLVAGLRCEIDELNQSHAAQLEQYSEKNRALARCLA